MERSYKGSTLDSVIHLEDGTEVLASEFFDEDDPAFDYRLGEAVRVSWVDGWEWLLLLVLTPNLLVVDASVMTRDPGTFLSLPLNLDSYRQLFDPLYLNVFLNSLYMAGMTTFFCLLIGYPFAWALSGLGKQRQTLLIFLLIVPFWTNSLVRTYALKLLLATNGLINNALMAVGLIDEPLKMLYTKGAVIIGLVYLLLPFMILPLYSVFEDLRQELLMASHDLGTGKLSTFLHVTVPLTGPSPVSVSWQAHAAGHAVCGNDVAGNRFACRSW